MSNCKCTGIYPPFYDNPEANIFVLIDTVKWHFDISSLSPSLCYRRSVILQ